MAPLSFALEIGLVFPAQHAVCLVHGLLLGFNTI
jgi:hypothetical protein